MTAKQAINFELRNLGDLKPNPLNPRDEIDFQTPDIQELADSISSHGLLQPIIVTPDNVIIAGHRRRAACEIAGLRVVQVLIRDLSEREQIEVMLIENMQRRNLTCTQIASSFKKLSDQGLSIEEIARKVGFGKDTVRKHLDILKLPEEIHPLFASGQASLGYVWKLLELKSPEDQTALCQAAVRNNWLINELSSQVVRQNNRNDPKTRPMGASIPYTPPTRLESTRTAVAQAHDYVTYAESRLKQWLKPENGVFITIEALLDELVDLSAKIRQAQEKSKEKAEQVQP